ncbi:MAG: twin-arginine translocase TatA/TatE family subunit [Alphaproteobacteria bacterium]
MFDLSFGEIFVVLVVALLCVGPKELPTVARACARFFRGMRGFMHEVKSVFNEVADEPTVRMIRGDDGKLYESYELPVNAPSKKDN